MRFFIHLAYDGTRYHGWQIQPNGISVEGEIERCLTTLLRQPIDIVGAGRTDAGVHARHMVAHFDIQPPALLAGESGTSGASDYAIQLCRRLNRMLPPDISIYRIEPVADDMHARFSATSRTYHYYLTTQRDPFHRHYAWQCHYDLDFQLMNEAAAMLMRHSDFAAFCKSHSDVKTTLCTVTEAQWVQTSGEQLVQTSDTPLVHTSGEQWYFRITANRFLRNMVRAVVGTLVEVGRHRMTPEQFREVIEQGQRTRAGESMPAHALFLERVEYQ